MKTTISADNKKSAFIYMIISSVFFTLMSTAVKCDNNVLFIHKVFFRNFITFIIISLIIHRSRILLPSRNNNKKLLILRAVTGLTGVLFYFYSLKTLSLADACILNKLSPFFIIILSSVFLKEKFLKLNFLLLIAAFAGTLLIIKPTFNLTFYPAVAAVLSALFAGISYTIIRSLKNKELPEVIILYFSGVSTLLLLIPSILYFEIYSFKQIFILFLIGFFATGGQIFLTKGFQAYNAGTVSIVSYSQIIISYLIDFLIFKIFPDIYSLAGGILIILSGTLLYLKKS